MGIFRAHLAAIGCKGLTRLLPLASCLLLCVVAGVYVYILYVPTHNHQIGFSAKFKYNLKADSSSQTPCRATLECMVVDGLAYASIYTS